MPFRPASSSLLFVSRFIRLFAYGSLSVVLVFYLIAIGLTQPQAGLLLALTLFGDTAVSFLITTHAERAGHRRMLLAGATLMVVAGAVFALTNTFWILLVAAIVGIISPSGQEVGPFLPIEQALLAETVRDRNRTHVFAWYTLTGTIATALGALAAGGLAALTPVSAPIERYRSVVLLYAALGIALIFVFLLLPQDPRRADDHAVNGSERGPFASFSGIERSRPVVLKLS